jgi:hypothetical protein
MSRTPTGAVTRVAADIKASGRVEDVWCGRGGGNNPAACAGFLWVWVWRDGAGPGDRND